MDTGRDLPANPVAVDGSLAADQPSYNVPPARLI